MIWLLSILNIYLRFDDDDVTTTETAAGDEAEATLGKDPAWRGMLVKPGEHKRLL